MPDSKLNFYIDMINLPAQYNSMKAEIDFAINTVLQRGDFINGEETRSLENRLKEYLHIQHVITCGNGTDALQIALMALEIDAGDEVIIPAFAYISVIETLVLLGAKPILVDVEEDYFFIDTGKIEKAITQKTKAIIAVHLFGQTGNFNELLKIAETYNLFVIEDNAQSLGSKYQIGSEEKLLGTIGHIGFTSFFPTKNLACFGDGGAIFTENKDLAEKMKMIATHGQSSKYKHQFLGINSRLDTIQAAILLVKLNHFKDHLQRKKEIAALYISHLQETSIINIPIENTKCKHTWHQFTIKIKEAYRNNLKLFLDQNGISSCIYYPQPLHFQEAYKFLDYLTGDFPSAENLSKSVLSLPIHPQLTDDEVLYIISKIKEFENQC